MEHREVILWLLVPADQNASEPIHPAMGAFHDPATRLGASAALQLFHLLAARADMTGEAKLLNKGTHLVIVIAFVHAHSLRLFRRRSGPLDGDTFESLLNHFHIVAVGSIHGDAHRYALGFDEHAPLDPSLGPVGRVFPRLFPPRGELWSCSRPCSANPNRCPSGNRIRAGLPSTSRR